MLIILTGGAAAMTALFFAVRPYLRRSIVSEREPVADVRSFWESGRRQLKEGNVHLALEKLDAAVAQGRLQPDTLNREENRRLHQLRRQCDLLAHLLDDPLEDILRQALRHRNAEEWRAKFADYRGRTVVFEDVLRSEAADRLALVSYTVCVGDVEARLALEELTLLRRLPLDPPQRWLFGVRLADCRREEGGIWVFHFEPESAVLLTDDIAVAACWPGSVDDELHAMLRRQTQWLRR